MAALANFLFDFYTVIMLLLTLSGRFRAGFSVGGAFFANSFIPVICNKTWAGSLSFVLDKTVLRAINWMFHFVYSFISVF